MSWSDSFYDKLPPLLNSSFGMEDISGMNTWADGHSSLTRPTYGVKNDAEYLEYIEYLAATTMPLTHIPRRYVTASEDAFDWAVSSVCYDLQEDFQFETGKPNHLLWENFQLPNPTTNKAMDATDVQ
jgi:hypothetical protein